MSGVISAPGVTHCTSTKFSLRFILSGYLVRMGRQLGVPTPVHEMAYLALKPYMHGTPKLPPD